MFIPFVGCVLRSWNIVDMGDHYLPNSEKNWGVQLYTNRRDYTTRRNEYALSRRFREISACKLFRKWVTYYCIDFLCMLSKLKKFLYGIWRKISTEIRFWSCILEYTGVDITQHESLRRLYGGGDYFKARLAGFCPSDGEDEPHSVTIPLTGRAVGGEDSENEPDGVGALHRLHASDSDMTHSSSPSTRSTQSTGVLHTFHPVGPPSHSRLTQQCSASAARDAGCPTTAAVAVVHAMPHSVTSRPQCVTRILDGSLHNPRPPDTGQAPLGL